MSFGRLYIVGLWHNTYVRWLLGRLKSWFRFIYFLFFLSSLILPPHKLHRSRRPRKRLTSSRAKGTARRWSRWRTTCRSCCGAIPAGSTTPTCTESTSTTIWACPVMDLHAALIERHLEWIDSKHVCSELRIYSTFPFEIFVRTRLTSIL